MPLVDALADLIDQVGFAYRDFYATQAQIRRHIVPVNIIACSQLLDSFFSCGLGN